MRIVARVSGHWLHGSIELSGQRIQDVLNAPGTEFLEISDVAVSYSIRETEQDRHLPYLTIPKSKLEMVLGQVTTHEAPQRRIDCHKKTTAEQAFATVGNLNVFGDAHLSSKTKNSQHAYANVLSRFFPVSQATIAGPDLANHEAPIVFVNRDLASSFQLGECLAPLAEPAAELSEEEKIRDLLGGFREIIEGAENGQHTAKSTAKDDAETSVPITSD